MFHTADPKEIKEGKLTDIYFVRTMRVLKAKKTEKWVKAEFIAKRFPEDYGWDSFARPWVWQRRLPAAKRQRGIGR